MVTQPFLRSKTIVMQTIENVLIIDDDPTSIYLTRRVLSSLGVGTSVEAAQTGMEGLKLLEDAKNNRRSPQLILLDVNMQGMGGFAFLEELGKRQYVNLIDTRIVLLTGSEDPADLRLAKMHLAADYVPKPLTKDKLRRILYR